MMEEEGKEGEISPPPPPLLPLPWLVLPSHSRYRPSMSSTTTAKCSTNARTGEPFLVPMRLSPKAKPFRIKIAPRMVHGQDSG